MTLIKQKNSFNQTIKRVCGFMELKLRWFWGQNIQRNFCTWICQITCQNSLKKRTIIAEPSKWLEKCTCTHLIPKNWWPEMMTPQKWLLDKKNSFGLYVLIVFQVLVSQMKICFFPTRALKKICHTLSTFLPKKKVLYVKKNFI